MTTESASHVEDQWYLAQPPATVVRDREAELDRNLRLLVELVGSVIEEGEGDAGT